MAVEQRRVLVRGDVVTFGVAVVLFDALMMWGAANSGLPYDYGTNVLTFGFIICNIGGLIFFPIRTELSKSEAMPMLAFSTIVGFSLMMIGGGIVQYDEAHKKQSVQATPVDIISIWNKEVLQ